MILDGHHQPLLGLSRKEGDGLPQPRLDALRRLFCGFHICLNLYTRHVFYSSPLCFLAVNQLVAEVEEMIAVGVDAEHTGVGVVLGTELPPEFADGQRLAAHIDAGIIEK